MRQQDGPRTSGQVTRDDLLPLVKLGEALLASYRRFETVHLLSPEKPSHLKLVVGMRLNEAEEAVLQELGKFGRSGEFPNYIDGCGPYGMDTEVFEALDAFWLATCSPRFKEWWRGGAAAPDLERRVDGLRRTLELMRATARPVDVKSDVVGEPDHPTSATSAAFRFVGQGDYWNVAFGGKTLSIKHSSGMEYVARLLAQPNPTKPIPATAFFGEGKGFAPLEHKCQPVLDDAAKREYQSQLKELEVDEEEATRAHDDEELLRIQNTKDALIEQLRGAIGLQGSDRELGPASPARKAAENVRKGIGRVRQRLEKAGLDNLAAHLKETIRPEGNAFAYRPAPPAPTWEL